MASEAEKTHKRIKGLNKQLSLAKNAQERREITGKIKEEKDNWFFSVAPCFGVRIK